MANFLRGLLLFFLALPALSACGNAKEREFPLGDAQAPYLGSVRVRVMDQDRSDITARDTGTASAHFVDQEDGSARLVVVGNIRKAADAGFAVDGSYDEAGWQSQMGGVRLSIGRDGTISGGGDSESQRLRFSGSASRTSFRMDVELELLASNAGGMPPGTRFLFSYDLSRDSGEQGRAPLQSDVAEAAGGNSERRCERIVWKVRNVAGFGGSMQMIQVPECIYR